MNEAADRGPAIWLGDALRVITRLDASPSAAARIVALLGLGTPAPPPPPPVVRLIDPEAPTMTRAPLPTESEGRTRSGEIGAALRELAQEEPAVVERDLAGPTLEPPRPLPDRRTVLPSATPIQLGPGSLLAPSQHRALLGALCARPAAIGDVDIDETVERLARREPLWALPRETIRTTARGLQLLVDFGDGMRGFQRDRDEVWALVGKLAGEDGLDVLRFAGTPLDPPGVGPRQRSSWSRYEPPAWGRPILVLSDLGTGAPSGEIDAVVERWERFAALTHAAGCPVTSLVPAPVHRVAEPLRRALAPISWDRGTTVRGAIAAARRASGHLRSRGS